MSDNTPFTPLPGITTLCQAFQRTAALAPPDAVALRTLDGSNTVTWSEYRERVRQVAEGLHALGLRKGDTVAHLLSNRPEFNVIDTAAMHLGLISFSLYNTLPAHEIQYQLENSDARLVVTEPQYLHKVLAARTPLVSDVVLVDGVHEEAMTLQALMALRSPGFDFDASWNAVTGDHLLTLIYTSGTTGPPKGVELTHANLLFQNRAMTARFPGAPGEVALSYLPAAHLADRWTTHYWPSMCCGAQIVTVADMAQIMQAYVQVRPKMLITVPRFFEKLKAALIAAGIADPGALDTRARHQALVRIGFDRLEYPIVAGAPVSASLLRYFEGLGLPLLEAWGMTEVTGLATIAPRDAVRLGSAGTPLPGYEVKLAQDDELLIRGAGVMRGYRKDPQRTAEAIDPDGWMLSGDIGRIDADGYVSVIDRKKEIIISAGGKNMSPANIERQLLAASPLIGHAVCFGDSRPYNVALLVLAPDVATAWARERGLGGPGDAGTDLGALAVNADLRVELEQAVQRANAELSRVEQIKRFAVLPTEWLASSDELTPTAKLKRKPIAAKYEQIIQQLYEPIDA